MLKSFKFNLEKIIDYILMAAISASVMFLYQTSSSIDETNRNIAIIAAKLLNVNSSLEKQTLVVRQHVIDITAAQEQIKADKERIQRLETELRELRRR